MTCRDLLRLLDARNVLAFSMQDGMAVVACGNLVFTPQRKRLEGGIRLASEDGQRFAVLDAIFTGEEYDVIMCRAEYRYRHRFAGKETR